MGKTWKENHRKKIVNGDTALQAVKDGYRVVVGHACGEPQALVKALVDRAAQLRDVEVVHMVALGPAEYAQSGMEGSFRGANGGSAVLRAGKNEIWEPVKKA